MKALDLFCGEGGASMGLHRTGFEVTGVDIIDQPRYPFNFIKANALEVPLDDYDFIWASPPCQAYSNLTPKESKVNHKKLIQSVRIRLIESYKPYCIENVGGAKNDLINPCMLCGTMFGLKTWRHRYFETSFGLTAPSKCDHSVMPLLVTTASKGSREKRKKLGIKPKSVKNAPEAYDIDWMDFKGLKEAIPPAYSYYIATEFLKIIENFT